MSFNERTHNNFVKRRGILIWPECRNFLGALICVPNYPRHLFVDAKKKKNYLFHQRQTNKEFELSGIFLTNPRNQCLGKNLFKDF